MIVSQVEPIPLQDQIGAMVGVRKINLLPAGMAAMTVATTVLLAAQLAPALAIQVDFFPYSNGWLGADAAYSIPLDAITTVWLFGDTFAGSRRAESTMIHNSIAIRRCKETCESTYWWSGQNTAEPDSFFKTPASNYFWPLDGFLAEGRLYIFLEEMRATKEGGAFGFDYRSIQLVTISNPMAAPDKWRVSYRVVSEGNQVAPGIATAWCRRIIKATHMRSHCSGAPQASRL